MNYEEFIASKKHTTNSYGFEPVWYPDEIFDFQKEIISRATKKGRIGIFADTGLGKTRISLSIANNVLIKTGKRVLILTPLAVAFQFIDEAKEIGIENIEYSKDGNYSKDIVVCNYERLNHFDSSDFECVILDESSILKNFNGQIKNQITSFIKKVNYRFLTTATPSPNDFIELGTSSEALGYMGYMDMLTKFFKSTQNDRDSNNRNIGNKFRLLPHAERTFFEWVNDWSIMVKKPSDIGFDDERYKLPKLTTKTHIVKNDNFFGSGSLFPIEAKTMTEVRQEQKSTELQRCEKAVELAKDKISVYWCNTNNESAIIKKLDSEAVEILGSFTIEKKEQILKDFAAGNIKRIITKAKMTSQGLNWQHCNHSVFFPTWSYEQYYQAIRRFWRFGQSRNVNIDVVISEGQSRVVKALEEKRIKSEELYKNLVNNVNNQYVEDLKKDTKEIILPIFI